MKLKDTIIERVKKAGEEGHLLSSAVENLLDWYGIASSLDWALDSIEELVSEAVWDEINDRFYKQLEFGTGGMRGRTIGKFVTKREKGHNSKRDTLERPAVGSAFLNDFNVVRATMGLFRYSDLYVRKQATAFTTPKLIIAHDVRHFSRHFSELAASVWSQLGGQSLVFDGARSTPQLSFTVRHLQATAGIVITASHNPPHDNGYKVYFSDGGQVVAPHVDGILEEVNQIDWGEVPDFLGKELDHVVVLPKNLDEVYLDSLEENVIDSDLLRTQAPIVVYTPIHGTGGIVSVPLLERFGVNVIPVKEQDTFDPNFSTVSSPNPESKEALKLGIELGRQVGADAVIGTDPDCDRMGVAVRNSVGNFQLLSGNVIGSLLAEYRIRKLKEVGILPITGTRSAALIKTFVTTPLQAAIAEQHGLKVINTLTGFKYIGEKILDYEKMLLSRFRSEKGINIDYNRSDFRRRSELLLKYSTFYVFGAEESYGYLASDRVRDKDGNAAALMFCELLAFLKSSGLTLADFLDEIYMRYGYYIEDLLNIAFEGAAGTRKIARILESYRSEPPATIGEYKIIEFTDFGVDEIEDADGKPIPRQDLFLLRLDNEYSYAVRGSGTEPKIKFYLFGQENVNEPADLVEVKKRTARTIEEIKKAVEKDAQDRAG